MITSPEGSADSAPATRDSRLATPLRVVFVNHVAQCSGAEMSLLSLLRHLPVHGIEAYALVPEGDLAERLRALGIPVTILPSGRPPRVRPRLLSVFCKYRWMRAVRRRTITLCQEVGAHLLHANSKAAALALALPGPPLPPLIWHCRDLLTGAGPARWLGPRCAAIIAVSRVVERHLLEARPRRARISVIYNGLDASDLRLSRDPATVRTELGVGPDTPVVISVGQLTPWKRHELELAAAAQLRRTHPGLRWLIAGESFPEDTRYAAHLRASAPPGVTFLGYRTDVHDLVRAADVFAHAATAEAFGRAVLEAMALGTPCVAPVAGGVPELLEDGVTGRLVTPGDASALAAGVGELLTDPALRERLSGAAQTRVHERFTAARTAAQVAALYAHVLKGSGL